MFSTSGRCFAGSIDIVVQALAIDTRLKTTHLIFYLKFSVALEDHGTFIDEIYLARRVGHAEPRLPLHKVVLADWLIVPSHSSAARI